MHAKSFARRDVFYGQQLADWQIAVGNWQSPLDANRGVEQQPDCLCHNVRSSRRMTLTVQLPDKLEAALKMQANAHGVSPADYVRDMLERELSPSLDEQASGPPLKSGWGLLAKYGPAPSAEEIDANRAEMFRHFAEDE